jgi:hypothetical protein
LVIFLVTTISNFALGTQLFHHYNLALENDNAEDFRT